eukprot:TRINITY_DN44172_c0_g1_i1.p1 TRINITY_DN44172_c0_g1~~TRINITY_DN44172_c0_g1_i1.p1  ORF type:complete len:888 (+),score=149.30 TRINITY_DN44172_c0_g1_i1:213-2666(+)
MIAMKSGGNRCMEEREGSTVADLPGATDDLPRSDSSLSLNVLTTREAFAQPARKGFCALLVPPMLSRCSLSTIRSRGSMVESTRRSMFSVPPSPHEGGGRDSMAETEVRASRRSFFMNQEDQDMVSRLAAVGLRPSVVSDLTESASVYHDYSRISKCWWHLCYSRLRLWLFLDDPFLTTGSSIVSWTMVVIIFASLAQAVLRPKGGFASGDVSGADREVEQIGVVFNYLFCAELLLRLWVCPVPWRFPRTPKNLIDLMSVLPFMINEVFELPVRVPSLSPLRWVSSFEAFFRLLKLSRYFWGWQLLFRACVDSAKALLVPLFFLLLIVVLGSCMLFVVESAEDQKFQGEGERPVTIRTIPDALHFSVVCILSMSTGPFYGLEAASTLGQTTVCALMVFGMTFMAMPIAIVGACFSDSWFNQDRIMLLDNVSSRLTEQGYTPQDLRDVFDEVDQDCSGEIEFHEFKRMIRALNLRSLNAAKCRRLFVYFDSDGDGAINFTDFAMTLYPDLPMEDDGTDDSDDDVKETEVGTTRKKPGSEIVDWFTGTRSMASSASTSADRQSHGNNQVASDGGVTAPATFGRACSSSSIAANITGGSSHTPKGSSKKCSLKSDTSRCSMASRLSGKSKFSHRSEARADSADPRTRHIDGSHSPLAQVPNADNAVQPPADMHETAQRLVLVEDRLRKMETRLERRLEHLSACVLRQVSHVGFGNHSFGSHHVAPPTARLGPRLSKQISRAPSPKTEEPQDDFSSVHRAPSLLDTASDAKDEGSPLREPPVPHDQVRSRRKSSLPMVARRNSHQTNRRPMNFGRRASFAF